MTKSDDLENRLAELEIENAYQRETIDGLSDALNEQWKEIDRLSSLLEQILNHMRQNQGQNSAPGEEPPPPHY